MGHDAGGCCVQQTIDDCSSRQSHAACCCASVQWAVGLFVTPLAVSCAAAPPHSPSIVILHPKPSFAPPRQAAAAPQRSPKTLALNPPPHLLAASASEFMAHRTNQCACVHAHKPTRNRSAMPWNTPGKSGGAIAPSSAMRATRPGLQHAAAASA
eukprot:366577-Chlamydomonas_euryale.AAC.23